MKQNRSANRDFSISAPPLPPRAFTKGDRFTQRPRAPFAASVPPRASWAAVWRPFVTGLVVFWLAACSGSPELPSPPEDRTQIERYLQAVVGQRGAPPSLSFALSTDDGVEIEAVAGFADSQTNELATPATRYRIYSISKPITAVLIMSLVEEGSIDLDDDLAKWVPEFPAKRWPIRVRHLLTHSSGIRHYRDGAGEISSTVEYPTLADSLVVFAEDELGFEPGTDFGYTSFGFNLLTGVIETATGESFAEALRKRVLEPAGMQDTALHVHGEPMANLATGTAPHFLPWIDQEDVDPLPNVSGRYGASGIVSTARDLVRLLEALSSCQLLSCETWNQMITPAIPDLSERQALGWSVTERKGRRMVYATGAGMGYTGMVLHYPDTGVSAALLANRTPFDDRSTVLYAISDLWQ